MKAAIIGGGFAADLHADAAMLCAQYPAAAEEIRRLTGQVEY